MLKMQKGDTTIFEECFSKACPKFISPIPPNYDANSANSHLVSIIKDRDVKQKIMNKGETRDEK